MPREVKEKIISYISPLEISRLLSVSRLVRFDISISWTVWPSGHCALARYFRRDSERGGVAKRCFGVVAPEYSDQYHSISLSCDWFDDSWTEQQARLNIISHSRIRRSTASECAEEALALPFDSGAVVAKSAVVRFHKTTTTLYFVPKQDKVYQLWCQMGLGSHHTITLENIKIQGLPYGNKQQNIEVYCPRLPINEEENIGRARNLRSICSR